MTGGVDNWMNLRYKIVNLFTKQVVEYTWSRRYAHDRVALLNEHCMLAGEPLTYRVEYKRVEDDKIDLYNLEHPPKEANNGSPSSGDGIPTENAS